jgi:hypothetical protein
MKTSIKNKLNLILAIASVLFMVGCHTGNQIIIPTEKMMKVRTPKEAIRTAEQFIMKGHLQLGDFRRESVSYNVSHAEWRVMYFDKRTSETDLHSRVLMVLIDASTGIAEIIP